MPEIYKIIGFLAFYAIAVPSFGVYDYYFLLDVVGVTQFQYSMLSVLHFVCILIGSYLFRRWLKDIELRTLTLVKFLIKLLLAPFTMMFVTRTNVQLIGLSDGFIILLTHIIGDIFSMCLIVLPMSVLFNRVCPKNIEATCLAMLAGIYNAKKGVRHFSGILINEHFVGVTKDNLDDFWKLKVITLCCSCLPLLAIRLIPTKAQIELR